MDVCGPRYGDRQGRAKADPLSDYFLVDNDWLRHGRILRDRMFVRHRSLTAVSDAVHSSESVSLEGRLAAALNHPNIATVHDVGEQDGAAMWVRS